MISKKDVSYLAELSRLSLNKVEAENMIRDISDIVSYFDNLKELNTDDIEPISHVFDVTNMMRDDIVKESYPRDELLSNSDVSNGVAFIVPKAVK